MKAKMLKGSRAQASRVRLVDWRASSSSRAISERPCEREAWKDGGLEGAFKVMEVLHAMTTWRQSAGSRVELSPLWGHSEGPTRHEALVWTRSEGPMLHPAPLGSQSGGP